MLYKIAKGLNLTKAWNISWCILMNLLLIMLVYLFGRGIGIFENILMISVLILAILSDVICMFPIIYFAYINKHPEKFAYGEPVKLAFYSIDENITVYDDLTKAENISRAPKMYVENIIVQYTYKTGCFREVVTGKIFYAFSDGKSKKTIGVFCDEFGDLKESKIVSVCELEQYVTERTDGKYGDFDSFEECLNYYEAKSKEYYDKAFKIHNFTDYTKKQNILKSIAK